MAAKVTIELDDKVSGPMKQVVKTVEGSDEAFDDLSAEIGNLSETIDRLTDEMLELATASKKVDEENKKTEQSSSSLAEKVTAVSTGFLAAVEAVKQLGAWGSQAFDHVKASAEKGNPAAKAMVDSVKRLNGAFNDLLEDPLIQDFMTGAMKQATGLIDDLIPRIKQIPDGWRGAQEWITRSITATTDFIGITQDATAEVHALYEAEKKAAQARSDAAKYAEAEEARSKKKKTVAQELQDIEANTHKKAEKDRLDQEKNIKKLQEHRDRLVADLKALAGTTLQDDASHQKHLEDIQQAEFRIVEAKREQREAQKALLEDLKKTQYALQAVARDTWGKMTAEAKKNVDAVVAKERQAIDALVAKLKELKGDDGKQTDVISKIRDKIDPRDLAKQIGANRAKPLDEQAKAEDDQQRKIQHDLNRLRQSRQAIKGAGGWEYDPARQQQIQKLDEEEAGLEARMRESQKKERGFKQSASGERQKAFRQAAAGGEGISQEEIAKAQDQMTNAVIDQAVASGQLTTQQEKALRSAAQATMEQAKVMRQQAEDIEEIITVLDGITDGTKKIGQKKRAQRGSAGG